MQSKGILNRVLASYAALNRSASALQSLFLLVVRLYWGWQFAVTGWGKLQHLPKVTSFFSSLGIPAPALSALGVSWLELIGGIMLALGFGSRLAGLLLGGDMLVAYLTAGRENLLSVFSNPGKFYGDDAFTFLLASVLILIFGPGKYAIDEFFKRKYRRDIENGYPSIVKAKPATA